MLKLRIGLLVALLAVGCTPGNYNVNVGVTPLGVPVGVATPTTAPSTTSPAPAASASPMASPTPTPTPTPNYDQVQERSGTFQQVGNGTRLSQSFKTKRDGQLKAVAVRLKDVGPDRTPTLSVVALAGERPDAKVLATGTLAADATGWATAALAPALTVKAGEAYAFVLTLSTPFSVYAGADLDTSYLDGTAYTGLTDGSTFWNKLTQDLAFRTQVE
jgi:hypothetical protein